MMLVVRVSGCLVDPVAHHALATRATDALNLELA